MTDSTDAECDICAIGIVQHKWLRNAVVPVSPGKVTFLFGINNSGKSTILDAVQQLGDAPREAQSWVIGYLTAGDMANLWTPEKLSKYWAEDFRDSSEFWFKLFEHAEDDRTLTNRFVDESLVTGRENYLALSTMFAPTDLDPAAHFVAWHAELPDTSRSLAPLRDLDALAEAIWAEGLVPGASMFGPLDAVVAIPPDIKSRIQNWADQVCYWDDPDWPILFPDMPRPESPPGPPSEIFERLAAPYSWLVTPSSIIGTLRETLPEIVRLSPFEILNPSSQATKISGWPVSKLAFLKNVTELAWRRRAERDFELNRSRRPNASLLEVSGNTGAPPRIHDAAFAALDRICLAATEFIPPFAFPFQTTALVPRISADGLDIELVVIPDATQALKYLELRAMNQDHDYAFSELLQSTSAKMRTIPITELAEGIRLWFNLAIVRATSFESFMEIFSDEYASIVADLDETVGENYMTTSQIVLVDEPERHLHPLAQRAAAQSLVDFAASTGAAVIAATHSPAFLHASDGIFVHVQRHPDDSVEVQQVHRDDLVEHLKSAPFLGFNHGELFNAYNSYLVVEGEHEAILLELWCDDLVSNARLKVLPMRGTNKAQSLNLELEQFMQVAPKPVGFLLDADPMLQAMAQLAPNFEDLPSAATRIELCKQRIPGFADRVKRDSKLKKLPSWTELFFHEHVPATAPMVFIDEEDIVFLLDEAMISDNAQRRYTHDEAREVTATKPPFTPIKEHLKRHFGLRPGVFSVEEIRRMAGQSTGPGVEAFRAKTEEVTTRLSTLWTS